MESRRQLFKLSVLSSLGLVACSSLGGPLTGTSVSDPADSWITRTADGRFLFFEPAIGGYRAYFFTPPLTTGNYKNLDLAAVSNGTLTLAGTVTVNTAGTNAPLQIQDSWIPTSAMQGLQQMAQGCWNEIGSK